MICLKTRIKSETINYFLKNILKLSLNTSFLHLERVHNTRHALHLNNLGKIYVTNNLQVLLNSNPNVLTEL